MPVRRRVRSCWLVALVMLFTSSPSLAVILYRSATRNTTAPTGQYANSGWQHEGSFGFFLATPIAPNWIISAAHVGIWNTFTNPSGTFNVDQSFVGSGPGWVDVPNSDLRLWKVQGAMPTWAPMWDASVDGSEVGKELVVYGRGTQRGQAVFGQAGAPRDGVLSPGSRVPVREHKGWLWGPPDGVQSWGANHVDEIFDASEFNLGDLLAFDFDRNSPLSEESALSDYDSGGAVFIKSGTTWKLAGINFTVDGPFKQRPAGESFLGSMFDAGGLYIADDPPLFVPDGSADVPGSSYSTRIASNLAFIRSIIGPGAEPPAVPEPTGAALVMSTGLLALRRRHLAVN